MSRPRLLLITLFALFAPGVTLTVGAQIPQPYLTTVSPPGGTRGRTVTVTIEGVNLSGASAVIFDRPGLSGKIVLNAETARTEPAPVRNRRVPP